jgi:hypothetical protein
MEDNLDENSMVQWNPLFLTPNRVHETFRVLFKNHLQFFG